jgi:isoleucyl-tRNA synthetase
VFEVNENIANIYDKEGSDCWFSDDPQDSSKDE